MSGEKLDHWKQLAEELGAEIPPEEPEQSTTDGGREGGDEPRGQDAAASEPLSGPPPKSPLPPRPAPPRRTASDWSLLAAELGIEVPPEPEPSAVSKTATEPETARPYDELTSSRAAEPGPVAQHEESRHRLEKRDRDEERGGRRPRRRRHRPSEQAEEYLPQSLTKSESLAEDEDRDSALGDEDLMLPEAEPSEFDEADELVGEDELVEEAEATDSRAVEAPDQRREHEGSRGRGKRRRRRKSAASRRESSSVSPEDQESPGKAADELKVPPSESSASPSLEAEGDEEDFDFEDEEAGYHVDKSLHRAIPSWYEAVNIVVSANLEARAKNPDRKGTGRSRGEQDRRGRDRNKPNS